MVTKAKTPRLHGHQACPFALLSRQIEPNSDIQKTRLKVAYRPDNACPSPAPARPDATMIAVASAKVVSPRSATVLASTRRSARRRHHKQQADSQSTNPTSPTKPAPSAPHTSPGEPSKSRPWAGICQSPASPD